MEIQDLEDRVQVTLMHYQYILGNIVLCKHSIKLMNWLPSEQLVWYVPFVGSLTWPKSSPPHIQYILVSPFVKWNQKKYWFKFDLKHPQLLTANANLGLNTKLVHNTLIIIININYYNLCKLWLTVIVTRKNWPWVRCYLP